MYSATETVTVTLTAIAALRAIQVLIVLGQDLIIAKKLLELTSREDLPRANNGFAPTTRRRDFGYQTIAVDYLSGIMTII